ncbi:MAG: hypothetical protein A2X94_16815 [Bdellovibrionales bacterium GWB1_55_8]|nr:MAG: hypothetical protein A2X94_16815 [Bdellovibrionales bacterium GWB1_55_8]
MAPTLKFKQAKVERQPGEQARLKVVRGPDYGWVFVVTSSKAVMGRGEGNDIVISDLKASRVHATLSQGPAGNWTVLDQGSANGILHNGQQTREAMLRSGDTITIGETTLEFMAAEAGTAMLSAPAKSFSQVSMDHSALAARYEAIGQAPFAGASRSGGGGGKLLLVGGLVVLAFLFLSDDDPKKPVKKDSVDVAQSIRDIASLRGEIPQNKAADAFFEIGFREYRQGNYLRARRQFETVLQVVPEHYLASSYLKTCDKRIEEEVKMHLVQGKKTLDAGKLKQARGHFESVLRLMHRNQSDPAFVEAKEQREKIMKQQGGSG